MFVCRYDQTSAQVKDLENRAQRLSREARGESTVANNMLKDITKLEQDLPSALKVRARSFMLSRRKQGGFSCVLLHVQEGVDTMASMLSDLTEAATSSGEDFDSLQQGVKHNQMLAEKLLKEGRASGQVPSALVFKQGCRKRDGSQEASSPPGAQGSSAGISSPVYLHLSVPHQQVEKLVDRVEAAREVTSAALQSFQGSSEDLNASLSSLKGRKTTVPSAGVNSQPRPLTSDLCPPSTGFNQQITKHRAEAEGAIQRLDTINATVQQAASSNADTQAVLRDMSEDFQQSMANVMMLEDLLLGMEVRAPPNPQPAPSLSAHPDGSSGGVQIFTGSRPSAR